MRFKEATKLGALELLSDGKLTAAQAANKLHLSVRQISRLKAKFKTKGAEALIHGNRGRKPAHTIPEEVRQIIDEETKRPTQLLARLWRAFAGRLIKPNWQKEIIEAQVSTKCPNFFLSETKFTCAQKAWGIYLERRK